MTALLKIDLMASSYLPLLASRRIRANGVKSCPGIPDRLAAGQKTVLRLRWTYPVLLSLVIVLLIGPVRAGHEPLWELGIGVGLLSTPNYRGSLEESNLALPFPYGVYRGSFLQVDREEGVRGKLFSNAELQFDLSLAGNVPVPDNDDGARSGMDSLDPLVEFRAEINFNLWRALDKDHSFNFVLPLRLVYSVGDPILEFQGVTFSPYLNYRIRDEDHGLLLRYNASIGPIFASSRYHDYFYAVDEQFVTPERPEYEADSGYSGSRITLSATRNQDDFVVGLFARYDWLEGAVFEDSPLVETDDYFVVGFVFGWIFSKSETRVGH